MNNGNFHSRASKETFEVLLDIVEKHFAALKILDCDSQRKITKSASFSRLPSAWKTERFSLRKSRQSESCENLLKKYTWDEFSYIDSNPRQVKVFQAPNFEENERQDPRKKLLRGIETNLANSSERLREKMSVKDEDALEYMEVEEHHPDKPWTFPLSPSKSLSSLCSLQLSGASAGANASSNLFQTNLRRSSRSDITGHLNSEQGKEDICNVSKSFGQFTFTESKSDSKEDLCSESGTSNEAGTSKEVDIKQKLEKQKRKLRPLMPENRRKSIYSCSCWQILFFLLLPVAIILITIIFHQQQLGSKFCSPSFNFTNVTESLQKLVHGQTQGVADLIEFLETDVESFKVVALVGGIGVGKSHVANIFKNFLPKGYFYTFEYFPPLYNKAQQVYSALSICRCNLVILENLGTEDITDAAFLSHTLQKHAPDLCVLILALFNTQVTDSSFRRTMDLKGSVASVENAFAKEGIAMRAIAFNSLSEDSILKCIKEAVRESHLKVSEKDILQIKQSLLIANSGCKGAYSKVQLFGKKLN